MTVRRENIHRYTLAVFVIPKVKSKVKRCQSQKEGQKMIYQNKDKEKTSINKEVRITLISADQTWRNKIFTVS